jgi:uncharacterized protein (DUF924 family)
MEDAEAVLDFWFGKSPAPDVEALRQKISRWYAGGAALDREIGERFAALVERALKGELDAWAAAPRSRLALILLLDQFPRSMYRDTERAFAGDVAARGLAREAFDSGMDRELEHEQRLFLIMPFLHAEELAFQERGVEQTERLVAEAPEQFRPIYRMSDEQSHKYREVIARFGRFPHRNRALCRESTPDEVEFLKTWSERAAPRDFKP